MNVKKIKLFGIIIAIATLIFTLSAFGTQIPLEVERATIGTHKDVANYVQIPTFTTIGTHNVLAYYTGAYIADDHDYYDAGEWYFYLYQSGIERDAFGPFTVDGPTNFNFPTYLWYQWTKSADTSSTETSFVCWAREDDSGDGEVPMANAGQDLETRVDPLVNFDGNSSIDTVTIASYEWDSAADSSATVTIHLDDEIPNTMHSGEVTVKDVTHRYMYYIYNNAPSVTAITGPTTFHPGDHVEYTAVASDADGDSLTYLWKWSDGSPTAPSNLGFPPMKTTIDATSTWDFSNSSDVLGDYTLTVQAIDALGDSSNVFALDISGGNQPPSLNPISGPDTCYRGDNLSFHVAGYDPDENYPLSYEWTINGYDMGVNNSTLSFVHTMESWSVGENVVAVKVYDSLGAFTEVTKTYTTLNHAPTVSGITGPTSGYRGTPCTWSATGSDAEGDDLTYEWYLDGTWKSGGSSFTYTFGSDDKLGAHEIQVRVKDEIGEYSGFSTHPFTLGEEPNDPPTISAITGPDRGNKGVEYTFTTSATDDDGDEVTYEWKVDEENQTASGSTLDYTFPLEADFGQHQIQVRAADSKGEYSDWQTHTFMLQDTTAPVTVHDYDDSWQTADFSINLTATDTDGVEETYYKINDGETRTVSVDGQPEITSEAEENVLEYWSVDTLGNEETHNTLNNIKLDKTSPTGSFQIDSGASSATSTSVTLTLTSQDETSGVAQIRLSNDGIWDSEAWETPSETRTWTLTSGDGTKTVYYQIKDNAGKISPTYQITIILKTQPTPTPEPTDTPKPTPEPTDTPKPTPEPTDTDTDGDGMPDEWEVENGLDPFDFKDASLDFDNDGLTCYQEYLQGKNPNVYDVENTQLRSLSVLAVAIGAFTAVTAAILANLSGLVTSFDSAIQKLPISSELKQFLQLYGERLFQTVDKTKLEALRKAPFITRGEVLALGISALIATIVFGSAEAEGLPNFLTSGLNFLPPALVSVCVVIIFGEVFEACCARVCRVHKQFRLWMYGVIMFLVSGLIFAFPIGTPGITRYKSGEISEKAKGLFVLSKMLLFMTLMIPFAGLSMLGFDTLGEFGLWFTLIGVFSSLIPVRPLVGKALFNYRKEVSVAALSLSGILLFSIVYGRVTEVVLLPDLIYFGIGVVSAFLAAITLYQLKKANVT